VKNNRRSKFTRLNEKKENRTMKTNRLLIALAVLGALLLAGCAPRARVGALRTESKSVELGDSKSVRVEITIDWWRGKAAGSRLHL